MTFEDTTLVADADAQRYAEESSPSVLPSEIGASPKKKRSGKVRKQVSGTSASSEHRERERERERVFSMSIPMAMHRDFTALMERLARKIDDMTRRFGAEREKAKRQLRDKSETIARLNGEIERLKEENERQRRDIEHLSSRRRSKAFSSSDSQDEADIDLAQEIVRMVTPPDVSFLLYLARAKILDKMCLDSWASLKRRTSTIATEDLVDFVAFFIPDARLSRTEVGLVCESGNVLQDEGEDEDLDWSGEDGDLVQLAAKMRRAVEAGAECGGGAARRRFLANVFEFVFDEAL